MKTSLHFHKLLITLILYAIAFISEAQTRNYYYYNTQNGLPSNIVYDILEDKTGFIWIATDQGVSRFDGKKFVNFSSKDGLTDNDVFKLFEDNEGRIWFFPFKTEPCFYFDGKIYNSKNNKQLKNYVFPQNWVISYSYDPNSKHLMFMQGKDSFDGKMVDLINPNNYFFLRSLFIPNGIFIHFTINNEHYFTTKENGDVLYIVKNHQLVAKHKNKSLDGIKYMLSNDRMIIDNLKKNKIYFAKISSESLLITDSITYDVSFKNFNFINNPSQLYAFNYDLGMCKIDGSSYQAIGEFDNQLNIFNGLIDKRKNIWYNTHSNGIYMFPCNVFKTYNSKNSPNLIEDRLLSISKLNSIYIGHENKGISAFNHQSFKNLNIELNQTKTRLLKLIQVDDYILGCGDNILIKIKDGKHERINFKQKYAFKDIEYCNNEIILATHIGFIILNKKFELIKAGSKIRHTCAFKTKNGILYLGGLKGLYYENDSIIKLKLNPVLDEARISDIKEDEKGFLWVTTYSNGVFITNLKKTIHLTEFENEMNKNFISSSICKDILEYKNEMWISSNKGINRLKLLDFDNQKCRIKMYTKASGLPYEDINSLIINNDTVYAASSEGLVTFNLNQIDDNLLPITVINSISINSKDSNLNNYSELKNNQNNISFYLSGILHVGGNGVKFKYRLIGLNQQWTYTENDKIDFVGLKHGKYTFEVYAINSDNKSSLKPQTFTFTILPPYYLTWWFLVSIGLLIIGLSYFIINKKIQLAKEKEKTNSQISDLKMQALRAQMNPHFIFNALTSIQYFFSRHDELSANKYMTSFASLIRQTLNSSRKSFNTLSDEIEILDKYIGLEILRLEKPTEYSIQIGDNINSDSLLLPSMLLQPLVENALIHGVRHTASDTGKLIIDIQEKNNLVSITIIDNGPGINSNKVSKQSTGLDITNQRIDTINQIYHLDLRLTITDLSNINKTGTQVNLKLKASY